MQIYRPGYKEMQNRYRHGEKERDDLMRTDGAAARGFNRKRLYFFRGANKYMNDYSVEYFIHYN